MRAPIRPLRGKWHSALEHRLGRFFWNDPSAVMDAKATPEQFRLAMAAFHMGGTIKITGSDRHGPADSLLIDNVDLTNAAIVDIGASDGSTSVDLINKLGSFKSYVVADLFLSVRTVERFGHVLFYDPEGHCILIVGKRLIAWPSLSRGVGLIYAPLAMLARGENRTHRDVLLLNPVAQALIRSDKRVTYAVHDVFTRWPEPSPDVIKVANLLRRLYFDDATILRALHVLGEGLREGGHLLIVDNPRIEGIAIRAGLYRRDAREYTAVARTQNVAEVDDLVAQVRFAD